MKDGDTEIPLSASFCLSAGLGIMLICLGIGGCCFLQQWGLSLEQRSRPVGLTNQVEELK